MESSNLEDNCDDESDDEDSEVDDEQNDEFEGVLKQVQNNSCHQQTDLRHQQTDPTYMKLFYNAHMLQVHIMSASLPSRIRNPRSQTLFFCNFIQTERKLSCSTMITRL